MLIDNIKYLKDNYPSTYTEIMENKKDRKKKRGRVIGD